MLNGVSAYIFITEIHAVSCRSIKFDSSKSHIFSKAKTHGQTRFRNDAILVSFFSLPRYQQGIWKIDTGCLINRTSFYSPKNHTAFNIE